MRELSCSICYLNLNINYYLIMSKKWFLSLNYDIFDCLLRIFVLLTWVWILVWMIYSSSHAAKRRLLLYTLPLWQSTKRFDALTVHLNYLHTVSQRVVVDVFNKAIRGRGMGHRSLLSAAGGSQCCSVAEAGLVPWQLSSGADLTHFVLPISFFRQGFISHVCHRTSPGCGIRKGSVRKWEAISVLCLTMSYLLSMSPLSSTGLSARCLMDSQGGRARI